MTPKSLFKTAGLIAIITILSKIIGFVRDMVIAQGYGAGVVSDAYFYAYQIPALALILLGGLGGPFHTATIAVFSKIICSTAEKPEEKVKKLLNSFITITGIVFLILSILIFFYADLIIKVVASGATAELQNLASAQLKIMSPMMLIGGVIGILYGIANVYHEFAVTSLSPTIASIAVIIGVLIFPNDKFGYVLAISTLIGAIGQILIQLPVFTAAGFSYIPEFQFKTEQMKKIGEILFPAMIATTIGQINIYVDMFFASRLEPGSWSAIGYANRIFQFPTGIIITALLVPLFPMFSGFVGKKDFESLKTYFHKGLNAMWFLAFPILAFIIIFSQDAIRLLFQRGKFDYGDTLMVSIALIYLSFSIIPYIARDSLTRVFYAFDDSKTPFYVAVFSIFVKALVNLAFINHLGIGAITLSTTAVTLINALLLGYFIRKKINLDMKALLSPVGKILTATLIMSAFALILKNLMNSFIPDTTVLLIVKLSVWGLTGIAVYLIMCLILKLNTASELLQRVKAKVMR